MVETQPPSSLANKTKAAVAAPSRRRKSVSTFKTNTDSESSETATVCSDAVASTAAPDSSAAVAALTDFTVLPASGTNESASVVVSEWDHDDMAAGAVISHDPDFGYDYDHGAADAWPEATHGTNIMTRVKVICVMDSVFFNVFLHAYSTFVYMHCIYLPTR